jgi:hypothetical protein
MEKLATAARVALLSGLILLPATFVQAGIGGPYGDYYLAYTGPEALTLLVRPDGAGRSFDAAFLPGGATADATLTLELRNANWEPVPNFPREDVWLEAVDDGLVPCLGGTIADADTDALGITHWQNPLCAGGVSQGPTIVLVNGALIELTSPVALGFNSPDLNGDLVVNLTDLALFAGDYFGPYAFRSDLYRDTQINLHDLAVFAPAFGASCP